MKDEMKSERIQHPDYRVRLRSVLSELSTGVIVLVVRQSKQIDTCSSHYDEPL